SLAEKLARVRSAPAKLERRSSEARNWAPDRLERSKLEPAIELKLKSAPARSVPDRSDSLSSEDENLEVECLAIFMVSLIIWWIDLTGSGVAALAASAALACGTCSIISDTSPKELMVAW